MGIAMDYEILREEAMKVIKENPDMFPTSNRIERKLRRKGVSRTGVIILDAIGRDRFLQIQLEWIKNTKERVFIEMYKNQAFTTSKGELREAVNARLHSILHANVHRLDEIFSDVTIRKFMKTIPGLKAEYDNTFGTRKEKPKKPNGRLARHTS